MSLMFKPVGILSGVLAGKIAQELYERGWALIDKHDPPDPSHRHVQLRRLATALLLQGAISQLVRGIAEHGARHGFQRSTGPMARVTAQRRRPFHAQPPIQEDVMAEPVPAGSDVSAGTYKCTNCGYDLSVDSTQHLPPCPSCGNGEWHTVTGGDSADDPYPNR